MNPYTKEEIKEHIKNAENVDSPRMESFIAIAKCLYNKL